MGAPVASGTLAGSTSGSAASIHRQAASSDFSRSVDTPGRTTRTLCRPSPSPPSSSGTTSQPREATKRDRRRRCCEIRPFPQRRWGRCGSLLRRASDSQVRLQVTADRAASKHVGDSRNRGKEGPPAREPDGQRADMLTSGEYEVRCFARVETRFHVRASMLRPARLRDRLCLQAVASTADLRVGRTAPLASQATAGQSATRRTPLSRARLPRTCRGDPSRTPDPARAVRVRRASNSRCDDRAQTGSLRRISWPARSDPPMDPGPPGRRHRPLRLRGCAQPRHRVHPIGH